MVDQFASDLRVVRERVDETNVRITSLSQEVEALRLSIPQYQPPRAGRRRCRPIPTPPPHRAGRTGTPAPAPTPPPPPPAPLGPGMSPQRLYDTAWADYTPGQWDLCISGFDTYLRTFPKQRAGRRRAVLHRRVQLRRRQASGGGAGLQPGDRALSARPVGRRRRITSAGWPSSASAQLDRARESFEAVMKNFPDSDAARLAKQNLDRLNRGEAAVAQAASTTLTAQRCFDACESDSRHVRLSQRGQER